MALPSGLPPLCGPGQAAGALDASQRRTTVLEVVVVTAMAAAAIALLDQLATRSAWLAPWAGALTAAAFVLLPLAVGAVRKLQGDVLGVGRGPLVGPVAVGLIAAAVVLLPFLHGFDLLQVHGLGRSRGAGPGLLSYGLDYQGEVAGSIAALTMSERGAGLAVFNGLGRPVVLRPGCAAADPRQRPLGASCAPQRLGPGGRALLSPKEVEVLRIEDAAGVEIGASEIRLGGGGLGPPGPFRGQRRSWTWILWSLLSQLVMVALPEEVFFRGYVLGRLRAVWVPGRRVLGVPFGRAHLLSALLFALIHLVVTPAPQRLLVFFPGLLFCWLAERARSTVAPTVHHALSNLMLQVARRFYG